MMYASRCGNDLAIPETWEKHNWERPYVFLKTLETDHSQGRHDFQSHRYLLDKLVSGYDVKRAISRRSFTSVAERELPSSVLEATLRCLYQALTQETHLFAGVVTRGVQGWADAAWLLDHTPRALKRSNRASDSEVVAKIIQGQGWAGGKGITVLLGINWQFAVEAFSDPDIAYARALLDVGRVGHALLLEGQHQGLAARMTPAVHEETASKMLRLSEERDVLYAIRLVFPG
ncbi:MULTISPECIES: hypothetical protein [Pseudomonas syringae group]|uniref:Nitroreductase domain-containing protein n=3 Tax=Pseudomonas syringae group TaxID=136849 RepID=A0A3M5G768_PSESS|nr:MULTISPECIES: hypothetical protein [Pseudomonas syringae group]KPW91512.1 Uncharacterized protein ALO79_03769 [Pseudomonas syringae pv. castaneae]KPX05462.1 hypothetical protein ALO74_200144 [Pseudomonas syringae pv. cunninghamiae]RMS82526.1 hypothetical protein ALP58_01484 [Pseudomonas savastanoi]RMV12547.1 hypothetical protein ALP16_200076 [Pseudomonas savastanoi]